MAIDPRIALQVKPIQLDNPAEVQQRALTMQNLMQQQEARQMEMAKAQRMEQAETTMADLYRNSVGADGQINRGALTTGMAGAGLGNRIPKMQADFAETDKTKAETFYKDAQTGEINHKRLKASIDDMNSSMSSLLVNPSVTPEQVINKIQERVALGVLPAEQGAIMARSLPPDPTELRRFLRGKILEGMENSKRLEAVMPKTEYKDTGKKLVPVDMNSLTNPNPTELGKTTTFGEDLSAETQRRGQDSTAATQRRGQDMSAASSRYSADTSAKTQRDIAEKGIKGLEIKEGANGQFHVINKGDGTSRVVTGAGGEPILSKDSLVSKDAKQKLRLDQNISQARELLDQGPTGSGAGALADRGAAFFGGTLPGGAEATKLKALSGWMTSNVPRMEGPQSNADTQLYREMAAAIGDETLPIARRRAALDSLEKTMSDYNEVNGVFVTNKGVPGGGSPPSKPKVRPPLSAFGGR